MMDDQDMRALIQIEPVTSMDVVIIDDSPLWVAWEAAIQAWLDAKRRKSGSENTSTTYSIALRQFEAWARERLGRPEMLMWPIVSSAMAQEWAVFLSKGRGLSDATVNLKLAVLASFYDFVRRRYIIPTPDGQGKSLWPADRANPFEAIERAKVTPFANAKFPSTTEMKAILDAIDTNNLSGKRDFALIYSFMVTCRRFSELISLKWGDLHELSTGDFVFSYRAKGGEIRRAVLPRGCYQVICEYLRADGRPPGEMQEGDHIFVPMYPERIQRLPGWEQPVNPNKPISNSMANRILKKRARRVGVSENDAHIHGLRHGGARLRKEQMVKAGGVDYEELMDVLGHGSMEMTVGYSRRVLSDPEDPGGKAAAEELMPKGDRRRRRKKAPGEQLELL